MIADINSERLQLAKEMGADVLINCKEVNLQEEGQAHYMFLRFLNLRISTKFFQENYLSCFSAYTPFFGLTFFTKIHVELKPEYKL